MKTVKLCKGPGKIGESHCVMSAVSILNGEEFSDKPSCVCITVRGLVIAMNDNISNDAARNRYLSPLVWSLIGTATNDPVIEKRRIDFLHEEYKKVLDESFNLRWPIFNYALTGAFQHDSSHFWSEYIWLRSVLTAVRWNYSGSSRKFLEEFPTLTQRRMMIDLVDETCIGLVDLVERTVAIGDQRPKEQVLQNEEKLHYVNQ